MAGERLKASSLARRLTLVALVAGLVGAPAGILRAMCLARACDDDSVATARVPFCSLPGNLRRLVAAGYYDGRSPDVIVVSRRSLAGDSTGRHRVLWPSLRRSEHARVPIALAGPGIVPGAGVPSGAGLEDLAPTLAEAISLRRAHPNVRSGRAVAAIASEDTARLVVV